MLRQSTLGPRQHQARTYPSHHLPLREAGTLSSGRWPVIGPINYSAFFALGMRPLWPPLHILGQNIHSTSAETIVPTEMVKPSPPSVCSQRHHRKRTSPRTSHANMSNHYPRKQGPRPNRGPPLPFRPHANPPSWGRKRSGRWIPRLCPFYLRSGSSTPTWAMLVIKTQLSQSQIPVHPIRSDTAAAGLDG